MEIGVRVETQPWGNAADEPVHVASAYFVFVAIDEDGAPRAVPGLLTETPERGAPRARGRRSAAPTGSPARRRSTGVAGRDRALGARRGRHPA